MSERRAKEAEIHRRLGLELSHSQHAAESSRRRSGLGHPGLRRSVLQPFTTTAAHYTQPARPRREPFGASWRSFQRLFL